MIYCQISFDIFLRFTYIVAFPEGIVLATTHPARAFAKKLKSYYGGYKQFYRIIYNKEAENQNELQRFINYINRGNYSLEFIETLVRNAHLHHVTMAEFFLGEK